MFRYYIDTGIAVRWSIAVPSNNRSSEVIDNEVDELISPGTDYAVTRRKRNERTNKLTKVLTPRKVNDGGGCGGNSQGRASLLLKVANVLSVELGVFPYPVTDVINKNISRSSVDGEGGRVVRALVAPVGGAIETRVFGTGRRRLMGTAPKTFLRPVAAGVLLPPLSSPTRRRTDTDTRTEDSTTRLERTPSGDFFFFLATSLLFSRLSSLLFVSTSAGEECRRRSNRSFARARGLTTPGTSPPYSPSALHARTYFFYR